MPEQRADLGRIALVAGRQLGCEDLAGVGINDQVEFAPCPHTALAVLRDQPLARAVNLQARSVDHHVHRLVRLGLRQRCGKRQPGAAPRERRVVGYTDVNPEQSGERAQQALGLPPRAAKGQAQQVTRLDRHVRVIVWTPALPSAGWLPGRKRFRRHPDRQTSALLQCSVVLRPVGDLVARPGHFVAARLIGLVGHQTSREQRSGPIRPSLPQPKPQVSICAPKPCQPPIRANTI